MLDLLLPAARPAGFGSGDDTSKEQDNTVMEKLLEDISFEAGNGKSGDLTVDAAYVDARLEGIAGREDLVRYVL